KGEVTSDVAVANLLGLEASNLAHVPRSILEVISEGIEFKDGDLALHCNFATIDPATLKVIDRRVGRTLTRGEAKILERDLNEGVTLNDASFTFRHIVDYVGVLVLRDRSIELSDSITDTDPWREKDEKVLKYSKPLSADQSSLRASSLLNEFTDKAVRLLDKHPVNSFRRMKGLLPANALLCRQPGSRLPRVERGFKQIFGTEGCFQARLPTERGIALLLGLKPLPLPLVEPSENLGAFYYERARIVAENLKKCDFIYVHIDEADDAAHDRDPLKKKFVIETIDEFFLKHVYEAARRLGATVIITADHWTSSRTGHHLNRPVPVLIYRENLKPGGPKVFSEDVIDKGFEFRVNALDFLRKLASGQLTG
ncbi:MAG: hypothetical protein JHC12_00695, partial [Thermogladius sp.]|nr:hypothetical protein [Thermogladius sp.]